MHGDLYIDKDKNKIRFREAFIDTFTRVDHEADLDTFLENIASIHPNGAILLDTKNVHIKDGAEKGREHFANRLYVTNPAISFPQLDIPHLKPIEIIRITSPYSRKFNHCSDKEVDAYKKSNWREKILRDNIQSVTGETRFSTRDRAMINPNYVATIEDEGDYRVVTLDQNLSVFPQHLTFQSATSLKKLESILEAKMPRPSQKPSDSLKNTLKVVDFK